VSISLLSCIFFWHCCSQIGDVFKKREKENKYVVFVDVDLYPSPHGLASSFFLTGSTRDFWGSHTLPRRVHVPKLELIVTTHIV
jgi:hypothetical protein